MKKIPAPGKAYISVLSIALLLSFSGCADSITDQGEDFVPVIYMAGVGKNQSGEAVATYWKNGIATHLTAHHPTAYTYNTAAFAVTASGEDVYVAGVTHTSQGSFATYWKNGSAVFLADNYSQASSIVISGSNVYVAGTVSDDNGHSYATYWKNGVPVSLTQGEVYSSASAISIVGADVYVAGYIASEDSKSYASYWKNGNAVLLTDGTAFANAGSLMVSGTDVYITGAEYTNSTSIAKYWKNDQVVNLTDGSSYSHATSIALYNNDVYVAGVTGGWFSGEGVVTYWKNGVATPSTSTDVNRIEVSAMALLDEDVYIVGNVAQVDENSRLSAAATFWKNGVSETLPEGENDGVNVYFISSIFITKSRLSQSLN